MLGCNTEQLLGSVFGIAKLNVPVVAAISALRASPLQYESTTIGALDLNEEIDGTFGCPRRH